EKLRLFVYGSLLAGERDHELLSGCECLGSFYTKPTYTLYDLGVFPALVVSGDSRVLGELYVIDRKTRFEIDVRKQYPALFDRAEIELEDGTRAEAYVMQLEQVRGKRKIKHGSFRDRFSPVPRARSHAPIVDWARKRF
ncbi:MAG TPA: gamma-glutamylcyclotransferase family protein, partial [Polyangiaceae bacterium]|nr:gamma-glutamylcyclotransferase family protein [Polyangiaceae bacterium]